MKRLLIVAALAAATFTTPVFAADVGVSISIGQPGFYGQIDIGDFPQPQLIYPAPIIIERVLVERPPLYLHVPPGHAKKWRKHCRKYNACGERVFFVQDDWYNREYVPRYQERHRDRKYDKGKHYKGKYDKGKHYKGKNDNRGKHNKGKKDK